MFRKLALGAFVFVCLSLSAHGQALFRMQNVQASGGVVPAFVQGVPASSCVVFSGTTNTCHFASSVTAGHTIVGGGFYSGTSITVTSITDNCNTGATSNTYTIVDTLINGTTIWTNTFWATVGATTASCTVTMTFNTSVAGAKMAIHDVSGITATTPVDVHAIANQSAPGTGTNAVTSGSVTTGSSGDYIFGFTSDVSNNPTCTAGTGYTIRETGSSLCSEDQVQSSAGAIAATFTQVSATDNFATAIVAFKHQ
jgi:hypothetical protein